MTIENQIENAMSRSEAYNETVRLTIDGDSGDALSAIERVRDVDIEYGYAMCDYEGVDTLDVWGFYPSAKDGEMVWRLEIRFEGEHISRVNVWSEEMDDGSGEAWFYAAWCGDEHDCNGDVPRDVEDAIAWAQEQFPGATVKEVESTL